MNLKKISYYSLVILFMCQNTNAQSNSSVALYGVLDAGVTMVTNQKSGHSYSMDNGIASPNLWGLRGNEDLGGGNRALFELINQFNLGTGAIFPTNGGGLFGRSAYVGLQNEDLGKVTFGEQYDFMIDSLLRFDNSIYIAGLYGFRQGPFSRLGIPGNVSGSANYDRMSGTAISNSVKYTSPNLSGLSGGMLYSFGGVAGSIAQDNGSSFGLNYTHGPFAVGAAYTYQRYAALMVGIGGIRNFGAGLDYNFGQVTLNALYTNTKNTANGALIHTIQAGLRLLVTPAFSVGGDYQFMKGNDVLSDDKAHQVSLGMRYSLSKSTFVYVETVFQQVSGDGNPKAWIMAVSSASGNDRQLLTRLGVLHRF
jgi:predicted porin